jgi:hypothetical protein
MAGDSHKSDEIEKESEVLRDLPSVERILFKASNSSRYQAQNFHSCMWIFKKQLISSINQSLAELGGSTRFFMINDSRLRNHVTIPEYEEDLVSTTGGTQSSNLHVTLNFGIKFEHAPEAEPIIFTLRLYYNPQMELIEPDFSIHKNYSSARYNAPLFGNEFYSLLRQIPEFKQILTQIEEFNAQARAKLDDARLAQLEPPAEMRPLPPALRRVTSDQRSVSAASTLSNRFETMDYTTDDLAAICVEYCDKIKDNIAPKIYANANPIERARLLCVYFRDIFFQDRTVSLDDTVKGFKMIFLDEKDDGHSTPGRKFLDITNNPDVNYVIQIVQAKIEKLYDESNLNDPDRANALKSAFKNRYAP